MISEFAYPCHGQMHLDTGEYVRSMLKYGKYYDRYWTSEHIVEQLKEVDIIYHKLYPSCLPLHIFDNSANLKNATDALKAKDLNLKNRGENLRL